MKRTQAIELTAAALGRVVTVTDYAGKVVTGRLDRIELAADPMIRVVLRIATREPMNESDGGGYYWSDFGNEYFVGQRTEVEVGDVAAD